MNERITHLFSNFTCFPSWFTVQSGGSSSKGLHFCKLSHALLANALLSIFLPDFIVWPCLDSLLLTDWVVIVNWVVVAVWVVVVDWVVVTDLVTGADWVVRVVESSSCAEPCSLSEHDSQYILWAWCSRLSCQFIRDP